MHENREKYRTYLKKLKKKQKPTGGGVAKALPLLHQRVARFQGARGLLQLRGQVRAVAVEPYILYEHVLLTNYELSASTDLFY